VHEFSIAQSICEHAIREAEAHSANRVLSLRCRVGIMRQLVPELMETAFTLTSEGTILQGARLELEMEGVRVRCEDCGHDAVTDEIPFACPACHSGFIRCEGGQDILLVSLDLEREDGHGSADSPPP